jgi:hypothetical protein
VCAGQSHPDKNARAGFDDLSREMSTCAAYFAPLLANYIGLGDEVVMERVQKALKDMVDAVNGDPPNSLRVMHAEYGRPCDELLQSAPKRFADLLADHQEEL